MSPEQKDRQAQTQRTSASGERLVLVNGEAQEIEPDCSVERLLALLGLAGKRVAVAVNREVVPRSAYARHLVAAGDRIEVLEAVGGG